jgi:hypothetical protein
MKHFTELYSCLDEIRMAPRPLRKPTSDEVDRKHFMETAGRGSPHDPVRLPGSGLKRLFLEQWQVYAPVRPVPLLAPEAL